MSKRKWIKEAQREYHSLVEGRNCAFFHVNKLTVCVVRMNDTDYRIGFSGRYHTDGVDRPRGNAVAYRRVMHNDSRRVLGGDDLYIEDTLSSLRDDERLKKMMTVVLNLKPIDGLA